MRESYEVRILGTAIIKFLSPGNPCKFWHKLIRLPYGLAATDGNGMENCSHLSNNQEAEGVGWLGERCFIPGCLGLALSDSGSLHGCKRSAAVLQSFVS